MDASETFFSFWIPGTPMVRLKMYGWINRAERGIHHAAACSLSSATPAPGQKASR
jgi:hypothetical protein